MLLSLLKMLILVVLFIALANLKAIILKFFLFSKMVDSMDIYKSFNINIGTIMKNLEMLKLVFDLLKIKKLCNHVFQILPYLFRYILDQHKTQQILKFKFFFWMFYDSGKVWKRS